MGCRVVTIIGAVNGIRGVKTSISKDIMLKTNNSADCVHCSAPVEGEPTFNSSSDTFCTFIIIIQSLYGKIMLVLLDINGFITIKTI